MSLACLCGLVLTFVLTPYPSIVWASTYVVEIPLDDPIYQELDTLNGLGYLYTYIQEVKPISRIEAARLTLEAAHTYERSDRKRRDDLAKELIGNLRVELKDEIGWLEHNREDAQPTMIRPLSRVEAQYTYSRGDRRFWDTPTGNGLHAEEGTPALPYNDGIPTGAGSNESLRVQSWAGFAGFLTAYDETAVAGPMTRNAGGADRLRLLGAAAVVSLGNTAISFGTEEMWWGAGHFNALSQTDNAQPFPAVSVGNIHPIILPWFLRYLGQFRYRLFFGQLDSQRPIAHPWIDGEMFAFKPTPNSQFGIYHTIAFGGQGNDHYSTLGFLGRASGFATGNPVGANTNSRTGIYLDHRFPRLRGLEVYQEILGEDNLTGEVPGIGRFLPFLSVSYNGGIYLPRLTRDGRTDLRFEYSILEPNYSIHDDSLYWSNDGLLMGDAIGPNASQVGLELGKWIAGLNRVSAKIFYAERAPGFDTHKSYPASVYGSFLSKEHSGGITFGILDLGHHPGLTGGSLSLQGRTTLEYVDRLNYGGGNGIRAAVTFTVELGGLTDGFAWN